MARIVGVHGIGHQFSGVHSLRAAWLPALKDGLARAGRELNSDDDFTCAFYGQLFRIDGKKGFDPPLDASDLDDAWEQEMLDQWWREAGRTDAAVPSPDGRTKIKTPNAVQRALDALSHSRFFAGLAERALILDLKQVRTYFEKPETRKMARACVECVVGSDTRVIIAHSLGSVVAYEALCAHPEWAVQTFVTLGSPLGISNLIFEKLQPAPTNKIGVWPQGIARWYNIADEGDIVALVKKLSTRFGHQVVDELIDNGSRAHDATRYLTSQALGHAVATGF
jgi:hypothetical protein